MKLLKLLKELGLYIILATMTLYSPLWIGYLIQSEEVIAFGWLWVAIWAMPFPPALLTIVTIASLYKWIHISIKKLVLYRKEINSKESDTE